MHPENKHSYLQWRTTINPRIINRSVALAAENGVLDLFDGHLPLNRVVSSQPHIFINNIDVTRRPSVRTLGDAKTGKYGVRFYCTMLKQILQRREMHSDDEAIQMAALTTLRDIVHDPERNYEAIKLRIPDRLSDLLVHKDALVRKRVLQVLTIIAGLMEGKLAIVRNKTSLQYLVKLLEDVNAGVRFCAISLIENLSSFWKAADALVEFGFIEILVSLIGTHTARLPCLPHHLIALEYLMYCTGKDIAMDHHFFEILTENVTAIVANVLKNLSILLQTSEGKELSLQTKFLKQLNVLLHDERPEIYESAARAMVYATIKSEAIVKALKLPKLMERLLILASNRHEPIAQRYCLQVITNLVQQKDAKKLFLEKGLKKIENIYVGHDDLAKRLKEHLLGDVLTFY